jgi:hypothetical protein
LSGAVTADIEVPQFQFNPLQTGWELIPFSFVVDWFLSIGKTLSAMSFLYYQTNYSASYGLQVKVNRTFSLEDEITNPAVSGDRWQTGWSITEMKRRIPCELPYLPHIRFRLDGFKVLDLLALIAQRRR